MFRKPEKIELVTVGISIALLLYTLISFNRRPDSATPQFPEVVRLCHYLIMLCLLVETFSRKKAYCVASLILHTFITLVILFTLEGQFLLLEIPLILLLEMQFSLRLLLLPSTIINTLIIVVSAVIGLSTGSGMGDRAFVAALCGTFMFTTQAVTLYREQLLEKTNALAFQTRSVNNLAAANHSFVEKLEMIKEESAENERLRITRELHDSIGYAMMNMVMMMNAARHLIDTNPEKLLEYCTITKDLASSTLRETRKTLYKLRAIDREAVGNAPIFFIKLCQDFQLATGIRTDCNAGNLPEKINDRVFHAIFRSIQVAFINALRHGNAAHITLSFWVSDMELSVVVWNNIPQPMYNFGVIQEGIGLSGIRERLDEVEGTLTFGTVSDGFELVVRIPRAKAIDDED